MTGGTRDVLDAVEALADGAFKCVLSAARPPLTTQISLSRTGVLCRLTAVADDEPGAIIVKLARLRS